MTEERFVLEIPPVPAHVGTARLFVGSVARQFGADEAAVEDAKIGVSEACTNAIRLRELASSQDPVRVHIACGGADLTFQVDEAVAPGDTSSDSTTDDLIRSLGLELIRSLFPDAQTIEGGDHAGLRFAVPAAGCGGD